MQIVEDISFFSYSLGFKSPLLIAGCKMSHRNGLILRITTSEGEVGYGEAAPLENYSAESMEDIEYELSKLSLYVKKLKDLGHRVSGSNILTYAFEKREQFPSFTFCIETALLQVSLSEKNTEKTLSLKSVPLFTDPYEAIDKIADFKEQGIDKIKIKGLCKIREHIDVYREITDIADDTEVRLRIDANRKWTFEDAEFFISSVNSSVFDFIEEPFADYRRFREFADKTGVRIGVDESVLSFIDECRSDLSEKFTLVIKPSGTGGIRSVEYISSVAGQYGARTCISSMYEAGPGYWALLMAGVKLCTTEAGAGTFAFLDHSLFKNPPLFKGDKIIFREVPQYDFRQ